MLQHSGEGGSITCPFPVHSEFDHKEVKEYVVGGGDGASQARLFRSLGFTIRKVSGLLKQIVGIRHLRAFPKGFAE